MEGEIVFHMDPCRRFYCAQCDIADCPIRMAPFLARSALTLEEVVRSDFEIRAGGEGLSSGDVGRRASGAGRDGFPC
jgi:hypothetical protein